MEAQAALAFVARRAGAQSMEATRWRHIMSLELGWMAPGLAGQYIDACAAAGLLAPDGEALRLTFDPKGIEFPRGFRPDPSRLPAPDAGVPRAPEPSGAVSEATPATYEDDVFGAWLPRVAAARGEDIGATMTAMEALQARAGGLLFAEAAILVLGAEAGLDVKEAAARGLKDLQA